MWKFTALKSDSTTNAVLAILKTLTGNICNGISFQDSYGGVDWKAWNSTKDIYLRYSGNFQKRIFLKIAGKFFKSV